MENCFFRVRWDLYTHIRQGISYIVRVTTQSNRQSVVGFDVRRFLQVVLKKSLNVDNMHKKLEISSPCLFTSPCRPVLTFRFKILPKSVVADWNRQTSQNQPVVFKFKIHKIMKLKKKINRLQRFPATSIFYIWSGEEKYDIHNDETLFVFFKPPKMCSTTYPIRN